MLHWYASETWAGLLWLACFLLVFLTLLFVPQWWSSRSALDIVVGLLSFGCGARLVARGQSCKWPLGVDYAGRVALVTGASSGVGYACAEELALHGFTVIMAGRNLDRLLTARRKIMEKLAKQASQAKNKDPNRKCNHVVVLDTVDLASEASTRAYAATVTAAAKRYPVAILINAAGVMHRELEYTSTSWPTHSPPKAGSTSSVPPATDDSKSSHEKGREEEEEEEASRAPLERMLATNAVGPMLLTQLLLPVLHEAATRSGVTSRIVNVASSCHTFLGLSLSFASFSPLEMIAGLERRVTDGAAEDGAEGVGAPVARGSSSQPSPSTAKEGLATSVKVSPARVAGELTGLRFVGYYGLSKLCVVWNTRLLARQVANLTFRTSNTCSGSASNGASSPSPRSREDEKKLFVACSHPGVITTHLYRELFPQWVLDHVIYWPSLLIGKTWHESAQSTLKAAVENTHMVQGGYYLDSGEYGEQSGVNCLSAHASNQQEMMAYGEWLRGKLQGTAPEPSTTVPPKEAV